MLRNLAVCFTLLGLTTFCNPTVQADEPAKTIRIGMIGLDTSHCLAFADLLKKGDADPQLAGCKVVLVYPKGSPDIESSVKRVPEYTEKIKAMGVEIIDDLDAMIAQVDAVLLETNDGRPHLEQVIPVLKAKKPVFIDKPIAASLVDTIAIFELAKHYQTPVFSSSSLRFSKDAQAIRNGSIGDVLGCDTYSPCSLEPTHPDLFWYGIHGCETLFTIMGPGVETVVRTQTPGFDVVTGTWNNGRIGTFRGIRTGSSGYGGTAFGTKGIASAGQYDGYKPLVVEIVKFFRSGEVPVSPEETTDLYAFMEAADESKRRGFVPVKVAEVKAAAAEAAAKKVAEITK
jgi:predicted dehydrogenase